MFTDFVLVLVQPWEQQVILEPESDVRTSYPIVQVEAGIMRTETEIRMTEASYISAPPHSFNPQKQPIKNDEEAALPKWYTDMYESPINQLSRWKIL
jgi:hypothetical protein